MSGEKCLLGGPVFDGERLWERGTVLFSDGVVLEVREGRRPRRGAEVIDAGGKWVIPGLVDLHSDAVERCIEMRPGVHFDWEFALHVLDRRLAACGITTFCHALTFSDNDFGLRNGAAAEGLAHLITAFDGSPLRRVRHRVHARYEITCPRVAPVVEALVESRAVHLFSLTDHTPGQGQFKTLDAYLDYQTETYGVTRDEALAAAASKQLRKSAGLGHVKVICDRVRSAGLPILSHDDDGAEKVRLARKLGVRGCEFPVNMSAIAAARENGMSVLMGAPNLMRDASSNGHLRASEAILSGCCDGLVSDYYPECLLQAPFLAHRRHGLPLEEALRLVTSHSGEILRATDSCGRLEPGCPADILVIDPGDSWVRVHQTWVSGRLVFSDGL
ncbi:MAG: alpha-D-ribose 1-methylphosphonate 5-triphosphate diphosphatase [Syntrophobacteraceae bacterium]|jgi:alpha-D-ribose 1-methylphosphonate 5-triphosphate diphosphatase|nr:alpha-D-ribose 1-methylphosphonate 5-triphosphate diphosphatase [Syntrophobacteraceae bacterium]